MRILLALTLLVALSSTLGRTVIETFKAHASEQNDNISL